MSKMHDNGPPFLAILTRRQTLSPRDETNSKTVKIHDSKHLLIATLTRRQAQSPPRETKFKIKIPAM